MSEKTFLEEIFLLLLLWWRGL